MSNDRLTRGSMSLEKTPVSNMWETAAIVEVLERKGLCTKQDLYDIISEFRLKNPRARIPETAFHEPYLFTETKHTIIKDILALFTKHGLTSHQSQNLLERLGRIIEMGQRVAKGTTHEHVGCYGIKRRILCFRTAYGRSRYERKTRVRVIHPLVSWLSCLCTKPLFRMSHGS